MKIRKSLVCALIMITSCLTGLTGCVKPDKKTVLKAVIIPKFEINEMSGDFPGEAQLFYEKYCMGCGEVEIPHMPPTGHFYLNEKNGVGVLVTGSGKTAAGLSLAAVLSSGLFDYSGSYIVSVGCAGGNMSCCTLGDVILLTAVCDFDLGHHVDAHERNNSDTRIMWFPDKSFADYSVKFYNADLCCKAYDLIKDIPLRTTEEAREVLRRNYPAKTETDLLPAVRKGTTLTGDNYWKGLYSHETANFIAEYYECPNPYSVTEMEEIAIANTAECFDLFDRVVSIRVIVNPDLFTDGETPENTWGEYMTFSEKVKDENSETLDIFEPAMHNLFDAASIVIDAILEGRM